MLAKVNNSRLTLWTSGLRYRCISSLSNQLTTPSSEIDRTYSFHNKANEVFALLTNSEELDF